MITLKGAFRLSGWLYWSSMNDVRAQMNCLRPFLSRMRRARWMGGSSRGFRQSQTAVVDTQWKDRGERMGEGGTSSW